MVDQAIQADRIDIVENVYAQPNPSNIPLAVAAGNDDHNPNGESSKITPINHMSETEQEPEPREADVQSYAQTENISNPSTIQAHDIIMSPATVYPKYLLEFKAGRMNLFDKQVKPDERHGMIYLYIDVGQHLHFSWKDRHAAHPELDITTEPGRLEFLHIESCKTGRIYVLKYRNAVDRYFFWMQDPRHELDAIICARVNELLQCGKQLINVHSENSAEHRSTNN